MAHLRVTEVTIARDYEVYRFNDEDGPTAVCMSPVGVTTEDGREFVLPIGHQVQTEEGFHVWVERYRADTLQYRVAQAGEIDTDYWVEVEQFSWIERMEAEFIREQEERFHAN